MGSHEASQEQAQWRRGRKGTESTKRKKRKHQENYIDVQLNTFTLEGENIGSPGQCAMNMPCPQYRAN